MGMHPRSTERRLAWRDPAARVVAGAGLGWIVLPFLVFGDALARHAFGTESIAAVVVDGIIGVFVGVLLRASSLGWAGLAGVLGGVVSGAAMPYLAIPTLLGVTAPSLEGYGKYAPGMATAAITATVAMVIAGQSRRRFRIRPIASSVAGLAVLAVWFGFWVVWAQAVRGL